MQVGGIEAVYRGGVWHSDAEDSEGMVAVLNRLMHQPPGPSGSDPYPALTRAKGIAARLKGTIIDEGKPPPTKRGVVY